MACDLTDKGDCTGCVNLFTILAAPDSRQAPDESIARSRAMGVCGYCQRKPPEVAKYNAAVDLPNPIKKELCYSFERGVYEVPLNLPRIPLEDRWQSCSEEQVGRLVLELVSETNREAYSGEALSRLYLFEDGIKVKRIP